MVEAAVDVPEPLRLGALELTEAVADPAAADVPADCWPEDCAELSVALGPDSGTGEAVAGLSPPNTWVSAVCGFFLDKADTHQIAPATANTAITTSAGATNLLESASAGALTICVRSGCPTLLESEYNPINSLADSPTSSA